MMKTLSKALAALLLLGMGAAHANAKLSTPAEIAQCRTLKKLQWAAAIDEKQRGFAITALDADNFLVVNEAIKAILVHHVAAAGERLQAVADRHKYYSTNRFAGIAARLLQEPTAKMRPALHDLWTRMPKEPYNPNIRDRHDLPEDMVYDTLAILEAKALRADAQTQRFIGQTELDWYRAHRWKYPFLVALFKYSLLPEDQALEGILAALSHVPSGNNAYYKEGSALLGVLGTYDQTAANAKIVATLMADATLADSTPDGRHLLIDALDWRHLRREQAQRLYARFSDARAQAAYFPSQPEEAAAFLAKLQKALGENAKSAPDDLKKPRGTATAQ